MKDPTITPTIGALNYMHYIIDYFTLHVLLSITLQGDALFFDVEYSIFM